MADSCRKRLFDPIVVNIVSDFNISVDIHVGCFEGVADRNSVVSGKETKVLNRIVNEKPLKNRSEKRRLSETKAYEEEECSDSRKTFEANN